MGSLKLYATVAGFLAVASSVSAARAADVLPSTALPPPGLRLRNFDPARAEVELTQIHKLSLEAFAANTFYQPIGLEEFLASYQPVLKAVDPELVLLAEDEAVYKKLPSHPDDELAEGWRTLARRRLDSRTVEDWSKRLDGPGRPGRD